MLSEKGNAFLRPLKNKGFKDERVTTMRLDDLGKATTLESNKSHGQKTVDAETLSGNCWFDQAFATMAEAHTDAVITLPSGVFGDRRTQIVDLASKTQLPGIFPDREFAEAGGLMSYGPSVRANFHRAATYVFGEELDFPYADAMLAR